MNIDQKQRSDIDNLESNTISMELDEYSTLSSPLSINLLLNDGFNGINWIIKMGNDNCFFKSNLVENDRLEIKLSQDKLLNKNIENIIFRMIPYVDVNGGILDNIGLSNGNVTYYKKCETVINNEDDIYINCDLFGLSQSDLNTLINDEYFYIILNFNGELTNTSIKLKNIFIDFVFSDKLQNEKDVILNRLGEL